MHDTETTAIRLIILEGKLKLRKLALIGEAAADNNRVIRQTIANRHRESNRSICGMLEAAVRQEFGVGTT